MKMWNEHLSFLLNSVNHCVHKEFVKCILSEDFLLLKYEVTETLLGGKECNTERVTAKHFFYY